jgi:hypothetical protein
MIGKTTTTENDEDLSIEVLTNDLVRLLQVIFPNPKETPSLLVSIYAHMADPACVLTGTKLLS